MFIFQAPVPWSDILTCPTVWMNAFAQIGGTWGLFTLVTHGPMYFNYIHGWNIRAVSFIFQHILFLILAAQKNYTLSFLLFVIDWIVFWYAPSTKNDICCHFFSTW